MEAVVEARYFPQSQNLAFSLPLYFIGVQVYKADSQEMGKRAETTCSLPDVLPKIHREG